MDASAESRRYFQMETSSDSESLSFVFISFAVSFPLLLLPAEDLLIQKADVTLPVAASAIFCNI
jgi:hypothetical protein